MQAGSLSNVTLLCHLPSCLLKSAIVCTCREEAAAVNDFRQEVQAMTFWPALPVSSSGGTAHLHPVWGSSTADNRHRLDLLLLLLRSEAERMTVWASPRDVLDAGSRIHLSHTSDQDWQQHLLTAWSCDQRLALCLLERYPAVSAVRHALEALVMQHADDPALQQMPEAALLLATPAAVASNSPQLTNLSVWAVCPLLQAMALMAGQAGAQPAVRAYCIRSLQATKPEEVCCPSAVSSKSPSSAVYLCRRSSQSFCRFCKIAL